MLHVARQPANLDTSALDACQHVVMDNKAGMGGGAHILRDIWDSTTDAVEAQADAHLNRVAEAMLTTFRETVPACVITNYRLEHRIYEFKTGDAVFQGAMHDDSCEYSVVFYYRIDAGISGGSVQFFDADTELPSTCFVPTQGDMLVLQGLHAVSDLGICPDIATATRSIVILHINSEPVE